MPTIHPVSTAHNHDGVYAPVGSTGGVTVEDEGTPLTARATINFTGDGVSAADDAVNERTNVTITGGGVTDHGALTGLSDDDHTQYVKHSLATAANDFLVASGVDAFVKKTLAEVKTLLGLGSAAYTDSTDYATASHNHNSTYLGISATAADSDKVDGYHASSLFGTHNPQFVPCSSLIFVASNLSMTAGETLNVQLSSYGIPSTCKAVFVHTQGVWASTTGVLVLSKYNTTDLDLVCRPQVANVKIHNSGLVRVGSGYFNIQNKTYAGSITVIIVGYVI